MSKSSLKFIIFTGLFAVPFVPFLVSGSLFFPFITTKAFVWRLIIELIFAAWVILALVDEEYRPKKFAILYAVLGFLVVIGLADLFGVAPAKSFWSNFERMEGYVSLLYLGAYFLVVSSVFREKDWRNWWNTTLAASALMSFYSLFQVIGVIAPSQHDARVDGTFGNAIYLAVYMLFHIFIALFLFFREKSKNLRRAYIALIIFDLIILYYTATRGAILGLLGGFFLLALFNIRNRENRAVRRFSIGIILALVVLAGGFFAIRNTNFVKTSPVLSRFATLNFSDIKTQGRYFIWPIAWRGFTERPILGWGQDNFTYIFQKHYEPQMYILEPWFDRAHNIFLDWLVAGGILGLALYLSLYIGALYLIWRKDEDFSFLDRSILTSLLAAYFFHNIFVFDHLFSYVLFFSLLAFIHSRSSGSPLWKRNMSLENANYFLLPVVIVLLVFTIYEAEWKPYVTNTSLITALESLQTGNAAQAVSSFERAYSESTLGRMEVTEQIAANSVAVLKSNLSTQDKNAFYDFAKKSLEDEAATLPTDAKTQMTAGSFLAMTGSAQRVSYILRRHGTSRQRSSRYSSSSGRLILLPEMLPRRWRHSKRLTTRLRRTQKRKLSTSLARSMQEMLPLKGNSSRSWIIIPSSSRTESFPHTMPRRESET